MYTTIFKKMKLFFSLPVDLIGDGFDVFGHMVDEFPARFSVKDDVRSPSGDEFVATLMVSAPPIAGGSRLLVEDGRDLVPDVAARPLDVRTVHECLTTTLKQMKRGAA